MANIDGGGEVAIGQDDPQRDRAMQREEQDRQGRQGGYGADPFDSPEEQRGEQEDAAPDSTDAGEPVDDDGYHPGQPEQPDRSRSDGLTGSGPAQPD